MSPSPSRTPSLAGSIALRLLALAAIIATLKIACTDRANAAFAGYFDLSAVLLVFGAPLFQAVLFRRGHISPRAVARRLRELSRCDDARLRRELAAMAPAATAAHGTGALLRQTQGHADSFVRYGSGLVSARFAGAELSELLEQRIESEDQVWSDACATVGFLGKMAPYFGMLATVIGMVRILGNMTDFSRISSSMALAMQGTLYGLVSFTLIYSPLLKLLQSYREQILRRNETVARWLTLVVTKADAGRIREGLAAAGDDRPTPARAPRARAQEGHA